MIKTPTYLMFIFLASFIVFGCKLQISSELYTSDIETVGSGQKKILMTNAKIKLEMPSENECIEKGGEIINILNEYFYDVENGKCITEGFDNYLIVDTKIPIMLYEEDTFQENFPEKGFFSLLIYDLQGSYTLAPFIEQNRFLQFNSLFEEKFFEKIDADDLTLMFSVRNDSRKNIKVVGSSVYINGSPFPNSGQVILENRQNAEFLMSKISTEYIYSEGIISLLSFSEVVDEN